MCVCVCFLLICIKLSFSKLNLPRQLAEIVFFQLTLILFQVKTSVLNGDHFNFS